MIPACHDDAALIHLAAATVALDFDLDLAPVSQDLIEHGLNGLGAVHFHHVHLEGAVRVIVRLPKSRAVVRRGRLSVVDAYAVDGELDLPVVAGVLALKVHLELDCIDLVVRIDQERHVLGTEVPMLAVVVVIGIGVDRPRE